jgi:flagellar hook-associated protein 2
MATSPLTFTGISRFSDDLQTILQRAVRIASLPIQRMQLDQAKILEQKTALSALDAAVSELTENFASLGLLGARGAVSASSSDTDVATVQLTGSPETLSYTVAVTTAATAAQAATALTLADSDTTAPRANGLYKLTVGSTVDDFDLLATGSGRTAGTTGSSTPATPVSVSVTFANGLSGSITANLNSYFVGTAAVAGASAGDTVTVNFVSADSSINTSIVTDALAGGEDATALAAALNAKIALNAELNGKVSFSAESGKLKLVESDTVGQGFTFTSSNTGTITTGLEGGGSIGGHSAAEIAAALNAQVALNSTLTAAGVTFSAVGGQVQASADAGEKFTFTATDSAQGTGFVSGLAGKTRVVGYSNTLDGLRDYINSRESALGVHASVINTSSDPDNPKYDLSLVATSTGAQTLTLLDSTGADLLPAADTLGTNAVFSINGGATITNTSNTITGLVTGLNLTIAGAGTATITVAQDRAAVQDALEDFVEKYNAALAELNKQIGEDAGALSGSIVVRQIHRTLRAITGYSISTGDIRSIAALGLELSDEGELSLNETTFDALSDSEFSDAVDFLGTTTAGFAGNAYDLLRQITDATTGVIQTTQEFFDTSDERLADAIVDAQERVRLLTGSLQAQLTQSDSLLASLESQQVLLGTLFEEQRVITNSLA